MTKPFWSGISHEQFLRSTLFGHTRRFELKAYENKDIKRKLPILGVAEYEHYTKDEKVWRCDLGATTGYIDRVCFTTLNPVCRRALRVAWHLGSMAHLNDLVSDHVSTRLQIVDLKTHRSNAQNHKPYTHSLAEQRPLAARLTTTHLALRSLPGLPRTSRPRASEACGPFRP